MHPINLYNSLPLTNKLTLLKHKAILLQAFNKEDNTLAVYSLNGYYIETILDTKKGTIVSINAFKNAKTLLKFIDSVPLDYLT